MIAHKYSSHTHLCNSIRNAKKSQPFPGSSKGQVSVSVFEDHRVRQTDLTIVHNSPSIRGPDVVLFQKLEDCELSDKFFVLEGCH